LRFPKEDFVAKAKTRPAHVSRAFSDSRFITIEVLELKRLASMAKRFPPDAPRTTLQNEWMRIRNNLFDDRSWFARSSRDLDAEPSRISK